MLHGHHGHWFIIYWEFFHIFIFGHRSTFIRILFSEGEQAVGFSALCQQFFHRNTLSILKWLVFVCMFQKFITATWRWWSWRRSKGMSLCYLCGNTLAVREFFTILEKNVIIWKERRGHSCHAGVLFSELLIKFWSPQVAGFLCNFPTLDLRESTFCHFYKSYISSYFISMTLFHIILESFLMFPMILIFEFLHSSVHFTQMSFYLSYQTFYILFSVYLFQWHESGHQNWFLGILLLWIKHLYSHADIAIFCCWKK